MTEMAEFHPFAQIADEPTRASNLVLDGYNLPGTQQQVPTVIKVFTAYEPQNFMELALHQQASKETDGVVKFYESWTDQGLLKMRMEYCEMGSLKKVMEQRVQQGRWQLSELLDLFATLLATVRTLASLRIAHRNIDCTHVLFTKEGRPKLCDFGQAKLIVVNQTISGHTYQRGPYSPIEDQINPFAQDVYSLGKVFFEMSILKIFLHLNTFPEEKLQEKVMSTVALYDCQDLGTLLLAMMHKDFRSRPTAAQCLEAVAAIQTSRRPPPAPLKQPVVSPKRGTQVRPVAAVSTESDMAAPTMVVAFAPKPLPSCSNCKSKKVLPQLFSCEHRVCEACINVKIQKDMIISCLTCTTESSISHLYTNDRLPRVVKEFLLNAIKEACESRKRILDR